MLLCVCVCVCVAVCVCIYAYVYVYVCVAVLRTSVCIGGLRMCPCMPACLNTRLRVEGVGGGNLFFSIHYLVEKAA